MNYEALRAVLRRANDALGTNWSMHDCRHTAAIRMMQSRKLSVRDVQAILGHAHLTTTQIYLTPRKEEVIRRVLAHHAEQTRQAAERVRPAPAPGYRPETLQVLFGSRTP